MQTPSGVFLFLGKNAIIGKTDIERTNALIIQPTLIGGFSL